MAIQLRERPGVGTSPGVLSIPPLGKIGLFVLALLVLVGGVLKYALSQSHKRPVATASSLTTIDGKLRPRSETRSILGEAAERGRAVRNIPMDRSTLATLAPQPEPAPQPLNFGFAGLQRAGNGGYQGFREVTRPSSLQR